MVDLLLIALEAHSEEGNHHRRYEVAVGRDLLGDWIVTVRYGRVGSPARELQFPSPDVSGALAVLHNRLRRRLSAPRRIGCPYRMTEFAATRDLQLSEWIPADLAAGFLS